MADYTDDGDLRTVTAATVSGVVLREAEALSVSSARVFAIALRWMLRYGYLSGLMDTDLSHRMDSGSIVTPAAARLTSARNSEDDGQLRWRPADVLKRAVFPHATRALQRR